MFKEVNTPIYVSGLQAGVEVAAVLPQLGRGPRRGAEGHLRGESNLNCKGWNYHVHNGFPRNIESRNLSRDNLSRSPLGVSGFSIA